MPVGHIRYPPPKPAETQSSNRQSYTCLPTQRHVLKVLLRPVEDALVAAIRYAEGLAKAGIESSVGSIGDSYDDALAATINGFYKSEVIHLRGPWRSFGAVEYGMLEWVDWFNRRWLLEPIGHIPTAGAEKRCYAIISGAAIAA